MGTLRVLLPEIVFSSAIFSESQKDDAFEKHFTKGLIKKYILKELSGTTIGVFSVLGKHAQNMSLSAGPLRFKSPIETAKEAVEFLKKRGSADIIICLSHSGVRDEDSNREEDEALAKNVKGIDIIISGHSHTLLREPKIINNVIIVQAGEFGKYVGALDIIYNAKVKIKKYKIIDVDDRFEEDKKVKELIMNCK